VTTLLTLSGNASNGLGYAGLSIIAAGITRTLYNGLPNERKVRKIRDVCCTPLGFAMPIGLVLTLLWISVTGEYSTIYNTVVSAPIGSLLVNLVFSTGALYLGGFVIPFSPTGEENKDLSVTGTSDKAAPFSQTSDEEVLQNPAGGLHKSSIVETIHGLAVIMASSVYWRTNIYPQQIIGFMIASTYLIAGQHSYLSTRRNWQSLPALQKVSLCTLVCALSVSFMVVIFSMGPSNAMTVEHGFRDAHLPLLDETYVPAREFDIVISMYKESLDPLNELMALIKKIPKVAALKPRLVIYTKDDQADIAELRKLTNADEVIQLINIGREGDTYLQHITTEWDNLAKHTMFMQSVADAAGLIPGEIEKYFLPETGMLTLGMFTGWCDCRNCEDDLWVDTENVIPSTYEAITGQNCTAALMAYKGQFIVSGQRIRGVGKPLYLDLLDRLNNGTQGGRVRPGSRPVIEARAGDKKMHLDDNPSNPKFGHVVERIWPVLMQCSSFDLLERCPSMMNGLTWRWPEGLEGYGWSGEPRDCQCLDVPI
jgi:hypothetical protein